MKKNSKVKNQTPLPRQPKPCIAGIGASAGGLEAIRGFFEAMPAKSGIAFVVIQHLYPTQKSLAADIIGKYTSMPVIAAEAGMRLIADHAYTIPPNTYPSIVDGVLDFSKPPEHQGPRLPIDHFFSSLGRDQKEHAIGIILSGSGSDGAIGLRSIDANGGIVLAQDPETAQFDGMPQSAISTGLVKHVLTVEQMPGILVGYASHPYVSGKPMDAMGETTAANTAAVNNILDVVQALRGHNFSGYKRSTLLRRIQRRMGLRSIVGWDRYIALLKQEPAEVDALFKDLFISVTEFFRDPDAWELLEKEVIIPLVDEKVNGEAIRVWVPGCATGEEAYSIAMLLLEQVRRAGKHCPVQIFASDTNEESLSLARAGSYPSGIAAQVSPERLRHFFSEKADIHHYQVSRELRDTVVFGRHNLAVDPPYSRLDGISCRNVLIYLEAELQKKILSLFHFGLRPGGFLFLGSAETAGSEDIFPPVSKKWRIFRHLAADKIIRPALPRTATATATATAEPRRLPLRVSQLSAATQQIILDRFTPAAVLINTRFEALYFSGPTEGFLLRPRGAPTRDLLAQLRDGLRSRVRSAVREATKSKATVLVSDARVKREGKFHPVRLSVTPAGTGEDGSTLLLVVFEDMPLGPHAVDLEVTESTLVRQLEEELSATKEDLQNTIERLESSNEDLNASNEEIISVNEELQSINEELESSKEELQSLNEELSSVNQQLENKVVELETANTDLKNLLDSSEIATICLSRDFHIKWFTPATRNLCNIIQSDIGRPINDFSPKNTGPDLQADAALVLENQSPLQREMRLKNDRWFLRHMLPYRKEDGSIDGVIITYADISETKRAAEESAEALRHMAESLEEQVKTRTAQLSQLSAELTLTEDRERRALAQDLHDDLGQVMAIIKIKLSSLHNKQCEPQELVKEIESLVDQANKSVRSLALQLSPPVLYTGGLVPALEWLGDEMNRVYGLTVDIHDDGKPKPLDERQRITVFRAVRELLMNVFKHAKVNRAVVTSIRKDGHLTLAVTDSGCGFDYQKTLSEPAMGGGLGLLGVKERISLIGGEMNVDSRPGDGTTITLTAPVNTAKVLR